MLGCADYKIPQVLRHFGILEYSEKLADIIDNERLIEHDTEMEIEIRAGMIYAIELIKDELLIQGVEMSSAQIDNVLWRASKTGDFKQSAKPYHLTKTIDY